MNEIPYRQRKHRSVRSKLIYIFILLILIVWLDELFDIPKILLGSQTTPFNWIESVTETVLLAIVGFFTISRLAPQQKNHVTGKGMEHEPRIWIGIIMAFITLFLLVWLNEIIDLPHLLLGSQKTPINWQEALGETMLIGIIGLLVVFILLRNISERTRVQDLFYKSFFFNPQPAAITSISNGTVIQANEAFFKLSGYDRDMVIGKSTLNLDIWEHPEDRETIIRKLREEGHVRNSEVVFRDSSGNVKTCLFSAETITYDDEPHILSMAINITGRKQMEDSLKRTEKKYRDMVEHSLNGFAAYRTVV